MYTCKSWNFLEYKRWKFTNIMENGEEAMWVNLKVLSKLEPFQRLNTRRNFFSLSKNTGIQLIPLPAWFKRWLEGSTRESDFSRVKDLYVCAQAKLDNDEDNSRLVSHLRDSLKGLYSLQKTYENDQTMLARIDTLIENVNTMCSN